VPRAKSERFPAEAAGYLRRWPPTKEEAVSNADVWTYRDRNWGNTDLSGYDVEAVDGGIGSIDEATAEIGSSYIVVDTGPWIFGKKVMLPAGVIDRIDPSDKKVYVDRTKDEIKSAPEFDEDRLADEEYRGELSGYYGARDRGPGGL
jgi:hypothetical protein